MRLVLAEIFAFRHRLPGHRQAADQRADQYMISMRLPKQAEMRFARLQRMISLGWLRLRGSYGANEGLFFAASARNLRRSAWIFLVPPQPRNVGHQRHSRPLRAGRGAVASRCFSAARAYFVENSRKG
jgi:hypothetical protein